ncbi:MAG: CoA transferase, partial [Chloroflexota bacterium]
CTGPVNNLDETFEDPQVRHRQMVVELDHPRVGKVKQIGIPIKLSETPGNIRTLGVLLGAHTDEILKGLGYNRRQVSALRKRGAVG